MLLGLMAQMSKGRADGCRQEGCDEQQDILRPYSTINYAWDEPSLPRKLVLSLPGNRRLGVFELDKVRAPICAALRALLSVGYS
jgi:hypothetical protein